MSNARQGLSALLAAADAAPGSDDDLPVGVVTAVTSGVVTVRHLGASLQMPRLESYPSPAVGHQVVLTRAGGRWVILGRLAGIPT